MDPIKTQKNQDIALFSIRLMLGVVFAFHGAQKLFGAFGGYGLDGTSQFMEMMGFPLPYLSTLLVAATEFFGGLALAVGVLVRPSAILLAFTMFVASFAVNNSAFDAQKGGMEYSLTLAVVSVALALLGSGRLVPNQKLADWMPGLAKS